MAKRYLVSGTAKAYDSIVDARKEAYNRYYARPGVLITIYDIKTNLEIGEVSMITNYAMITYTDCKTGVMSKLYPSGKIGRIDMMPRGFYKR